MTLPFDLNLFDALLLGLIAVFTVRGALRGFLAEMAGLVGIVAGVWLAGRYYPAAGKLIHEWTASSWSNTIAYVVVLCGVLIAVSLVSRVLHSFLKMAYADWINHLAGALAGALKGFALSAVLVALLGASMGEAPFMRDSRMVPRIRDIVTQVKTHLPAPAFFQS